MRGGGNAGPNDAGRQAQSLIVAAWTPPRGRGRIATTTAARQRRHGRSHPLDVHANPGEVMATRKRDLTAMLLDRALIGAGVLFLMVLLGLQLARPS